MATIQAVLRRKKNNAGLFPLTIRITKDRKSTYLYTGQYIDEKFWDNKLKKVKKSHPNSNRLNNLILKKLSEANETLLDSDNLASSQSVQKIKKKIKGESKRGFFEVSDIFLSNLKRRKKFNQHYNQSKRIEIFKNFVKISVLSFSDLDVTLLKRFESYLLYERKVSQRTAINYLMLIRTIYNFARKEYEIDDKNYPFGKGKIQIKFPETEKIGLNREEVRLLETVSGLSEAQKNAVNVWLTSFYFAGIRVGDVLKLKWSDIKDKRLYYRMGKNRKLVSLSVPEKAFAIMHNYKSDEEGRYGLIFPFLKGTNLNSEREMAVRIKTVTRNLNRRLELVAEKCGIEKKLSMHIARHTFGNISGDKIPIQMLQKLYRHSSITTTVNYQQNFMHKETDEALDAVINF